MRPNCYFCYVLVLTVIIFNWSTFLLGDTFIVTNTNDSGEGSLRQAMINANDSTGADSIVFHIPATDENYNSEFGYWSIRPLNELPSIISDSMIIDGTTQAAFTGEDSNPLGPEIEISGIYAGEATGFYVLSAHNVIKGLVINRFQKFGIEITYNDADSNIVCGNYIGTDITGTIDMGNEKIGIIIYQNASHNLIGGTTEADRNIISGNGSNGIDIQNTGADSNIVKGNYIGTDATGMKPLGNQREGINIWSGAKHNFIGGAEPGAANVISGNGMQGISIGSYEGGYNTIINNIIGMNKELTQAIPNGSNGIFVGGEFNIVGGIESNEGNVVSGNLNAGIIIGVGQGNVIAGNIIGTDKAGTGIFPNREYGIYLKSGAHHNIIGPNNIIRFNGTDGIRVDGAETVANTIIRNSISNNDGLGINTINGGNTEIAPPVILNWTDTEISGTAVPNSIIEIYSDTADEGAIFEASVTSDASGNFTWNGTITGPFVTATATDVAGNTSEFSSVTQLIGLLVLNTGGDGFASLRWAIDEANSNPGPDTIRFNIPTSDPGFKETYWMIQPTTQLPTLTDDSTFIDGTSQTVNQGDYNTGGPEIMIDGSQLAYPYFGIVIESAFNRVNGFIVTNCQFAGLSLTGDQANHNTIEGNYIGTNETGTSAMSNSTGIKLENGPQYNTIGGTGMNARNVISGNYYAGIEIENSNNNKVIGNLIGPDRTGSMKVDRTRHGILLGSGAKYNRVGGLSADERNIISANGDVGISIYGEGTRENLVQGNYIGTTITGTDTLGNTWSGIEIKSGAEVNFVGGYVPDDGNLISGNGSYGVLISGSAADSNIVANNLIGTDVHGMNALGNKSGGIYIGNNAVSSLVGPGNIISGNHYTGIRVSGKGTEFTQIRGNWIGLDITGQDTIPNAGYGITVDNDAVRTIIGEYRKPNIIAGNKWSGIAVTTDSTYFTGIYNNYVGTDTSGTIALGNKKNGLQLTGLSHKIEGNLISGNLNYGIMIAGKTSFYDILDNKIGVQADGVQPLPNLYDGIFINDEAHNHQIGPENIIRHNKGWGVALNDTTVTEVTITQNSISNNGNGGIYVRENANRHIQPPVITGTSPLAGTAPANSTVEVFSDSSDQGRVYEGSVTADGSGNWSWTGSMAGPYMTATATDANHNTSIFSNSMIITTVQVRAISTTPQDFFLTQNYPNPFNPHTTIHFGVKHSCRVHLTIYDLMGREVSELINTDYEPGRYQYTFEANGCASGVYLYRIQMGDFIAVRKMILLR